MAGSLAKSCHTDLSDSIDIYLYPDSAAELSWIVNEMEKRFGLYGAPSIFPNCSVLCRLYCRDTYNMNPAKKY